MRITWIGHACFLLDAQEARIMTDPFDEDVPYDFPETSVDIVTVSHGHSDHDAVHRVLGDPARIHATGELDVHGVRINGIPSFHDGSKGKERGGNVLYCFVLEGMTIAHLGDLGTLLDETQRTALADVDVLLIPVGGTYTIDAGQAASIIRDLACVKLILPMHYKTEVIADWPIAPVEEFVSLMDNVRHVGAATVEVSRGSLPEQQEVWILDHA